MATVPRRALLGAGLFAGLWPAARPPAEAQSRHAHALDHGACRFEPGDGTYGFLRPHNGDGLQVAGRRYEIPWLGDGGSAPCRIASADLAPGQTYLIFATVQGGVLQLVALPHRPRMHAPSLTRGNRGVEVLARDGRPVSDEHTLVGMIATHPVDKTFAANGFRGTCLSWFHRANLYVSDGGGCVEVTRALMAEHGVWNDYLQMPHVNLWAAQCRTRNVDLGGHRGEDSPPYPSGLPVLAWDTSGRGRLGASQAGCSIMVGHNGGMWADEGVIAGAVPGLDSGPYFGSPVGGGSPVPHQPTYTGGWHSLDGGTSGSLWGREGLSQITVWASCSWTTDNPAARAAMWLVPWVWTAG
jgi:hypothetical protein